MPRERHEVHTKHAKEFAAEMGMKLFQVSAQESSNVEMAFFELVWMVLEERVEALEGIDLNADVQKKQKKKQKTRNSNKKCC